MRGHYFEPGLIGPGRLLKKDYSEGAANRDGALNWSFAVVFWCEINISCFVSIKIDTKVHVNESWFWRWFLCNHFLFMFMLICSCCKKIKNVFIFIQFVSSQFLKLTTTLKSNKTIFFSKMLICKFPSNLRLVNF